ncbi:photosystem II repair protein Psb32 [Lyngbya aestuarii]|uniref:photosystem II repair protein Psb32 n=1 Tax=Lyngbya aestuarii TaxID=118322 RepID=UPI00403D6F4A
MKQLLYHLHRWQKHLQNLIIPLLLMVLVSGLVAAPAAATNIYQMPNVSSGEPTWIIDQSEVISRINEGRISTTLEDLAKATGNEVRLVTVRRLDYGETIESFSKALFEKWFPTEEAQANQTLLAVDTLTNNTAIVTGEAVNSTMPKDIAESVASETVQVPLRDGNKYNQAFLDASDRLVAVLSGQPDPGPPVVEDTIEVEGTFKTAEETDTNSATTWVIVVLVVATVVPMATYFFYQGFSG